MEEKLHSILKIVDRYVRRYKSCQESATDSSSHTDYTQHRNEKKQANNLGKNKEICGIDAHHFQSINLFRNTHRSQLTGNPGAYFAGKNKAHYGGRELENYNFTRGVTNCKAWDQRTAHINGELDGNHGTNEKGDNDHNPNGIEPDLAYFIHKILEEHIPPGRPSEYTPHQKRVFSHVL